MSPSERIRLMARPAGIPWDGGICCDSRPDLSPRLIGVNVLSTRSLINTLARLTDKSSGILLENVIPSLLVVPGCLYPEQHTRVKCMMKRA